MAKLSVAEKIKLHKHHENESADLAMRYAKDGYYTDAASAFTSAEFHRQVWVELSTARRT